MRIGSHEYANEDDDDNDDDDDVPKPAQSLGTPVPRQKIEFQASEYCCDNVFIYFSMALLFLQVSVFIFCSF